MIYIFFATGFEEIEAIATLDILRRAELDVQSVGVGGRVVEGAHGVVVTCDISDADARFDGLEMVVLPGGMPGTLNLEASTVVQSFIDYVSENGLYLAAICAAPSILGHKGLLDGKSCTCFPGFESQLGDAHHSQERVVRDGKLITGKGPGAAIPFAVELVRALLGDEKADKVRASLQ